MYWRLSRIGSKFAELFLKSTKMNYCRNTLVGKTFWQNALESILGKFYGHYQPHLVRVAVFKLFNYHHQTKTLAKSG